MTFRPYDAARDAKDVERIWRECGWLTDDDQPTLRASVNAFTRLWLGAETASGIAVTDELSGPDELLAQLDEVLRLPSPTPDWEF